MLELVFQSLELVRIAQPQHSHQVQLTFGRGRLPGLNARQRMVPGDGNRLLRLGANAEQQFGDRDENNEHS